VNSSSNADITIGWQDRTPKNRFAFDGPGGALAEATASSIRFDSAEAWEVQGVQHPLRKIAADDFWANASIFSVLVVALHEIGHVLGLEHSENAADVMSPFYLPNQTKLSEDDKARGTAIVRDSAVNA